jgi:alpha-tubulin suppressor-like RCC1 family protein
VRRRGAQALVLALASLFSAALVAAFLHLDAVPERGPRVDRAVLGAGTAAAVDHCPDVLLVGVDGGGERPGTDATFGRTVEVFHQAYAELAAAGDRSVQVLRIKLTAPGIRTLVPPHSAERPGRKAVTVHRARVWRGTVPEGAARTVAALDDAALACPDQQVALVGYAQGAAVLHRVLLTLQNRTDGLARVVGAALVSDPERRARSAAGQLVGAPAALHGGTGLFPLLLRPVADVPRGTDTFEVWNVCTRGDLVCNPNRTRVAEAMKAARGYRQGDGAAAVRTAAAGLWARNMLWPLPRPEIQVATARTGEPFTLQLGVSVAPEVAGGVEWTDALQVPPGLTLDGSGLLSGTPTESGTWNLTYVVRNTAPPTTGATGVVVLTVGSEAASVSAGGQTSCETRSDGTLRCWGRNNFGQLGDGSTTPRSTPVTVGKGVVWESVSASGSTTCGIRTDHTLWCWGLDNFGQLGIGRGAPRTKPVQVGTSNDWTTVSTSWFHTCGTRTNGTLWCWGQNNRGQVGDGTFERRGRPTRVAPAQDWATVTAGGFHTCGTRTDGSAWCWGQNIFGQLGNASLDLQPRPVRVGAQQSWLELSAGWAHTCGVTTDGSASCWGLNNRGQLGDGSRRLSRAPIPVSGDHIWTSISTGDASTCGVDNTGSAYCWGSNRYRQLGDGDDQTRLVPVLVRSGHRWLSVDAGWFHACGGLDTGATACWGNNEIGQIGNGTQTDQPVPEEVR